MSAKSSPIVDAFAKADLNVVISKLSTAEKISLLAVSYLSALNRAPVMLSLCILLHMGRGQIGGRRQPSTELEFRASSAPMDQ